MEMTRQRVRPNLLHDNSEPCPVCSGTGRVMGPDTTMTKIERWLQRSFAATRERKYVLKVHPEVASYILENGEIRLKSLRKSTKARLQVESDTTISPQDYKFFSLKRSLDVTAEFRVLQIYLKNVSYKFLRIPVFYLLVEVRCTQWSRLQVNS